MNQQTPEWLAARAGHCTASKFKDVLAKPKSGSGEAVTRRSYRLMLVTERLTGLPCETYRNAAMEWGTEHEAIARMTYEAERGEIVEEVGFIPHPSMPWVGCSPDGLIGTDGGVEIKCPAQSTVHVETVHGGMPSEHRAQIQGAMWVTGRQWVDFVSFDPRMPAGLQLYVERVKRDSDYIANLEAEVAKFLVETEKMHEWLMKIASAGASSGR